MMELERLNGGVLLKRGNVPGEYRDPTAATQPLFYTAPGQYQTPDWDATTAFKMGYLANVIAYRCVQIIASDIASVPLRAGSKYRDRSTVNENAEITRLLGPPPKGPAPGLSARKLIRWTMAQQLVTGRRAWEIELDGDRPVAFWPLVAANLEAEPSQGGTEWFRVFKYGRSDQPRRLQTDQVFYGWDPSGLDFRQAESPLMSARFDLSLAVAADQYSVAFLRNNATPATIVTTTAFPNDQLRQAFRQQWAAEYAGTSNAGRALFNEVDPDGDGPVGNDVHIQQLGLSQRDMELAATRKTALSEVAMSLGVPWSKLDASGRTFDNAEVEDRTYWEQTILPLLLDFEDDLNMQLADRLGPEVAWFDLDEVRVLRQRTKPVSSAVGVPSLVQAQLITIDEARADYGLPPLPNGSGARLMTVDEITALKGGQMEVALREAGGTESRSALPPGEGSDIAPAGDGAAAGVQEVAAPAPAATRSPEEIEARRARIWRTNDAVVRSMETRWERSFRRLFERQQKSTISRLTGKRGRQAMNSDTRAPVDEVFDRAFWVAETVELASDLYEGVMEAGFTRIAAAFGVSFDVEAEFAQTFVRARANQLAGQVTDTTYEAIQDALAEGIAAGEGIPDLSARVRHVFDVADSARATTIARTEVISAYNGSGFLTASQLPSDVVAGQEWIATRDGRTRAEHAAADGQVVAMDAMFDVGGEALMYPGDPNGSAANTVQCRCTVAFLTPDDMERAGLKDETRAVDLLHARRMIDLVHPEVNLLDWRRALNTELVA